MRISKKELDALNKVAIKKPLLFDSIYQKLLEKGTIVFSDEIINKEYHEAGEFEPSFLIIKDINSFVDDGIAVQEISLDGEILIENDVFTFELPDFYEAPRRSKKETLKEVSNAYLTWFHKDK